MSPSPSLSGSVIRLDTARLRTRGDCLTNAELGPQGDRAVTGEQDFLILHVDAAAGLCTAVPLFTKSAVGNQPLLDEFKSGSASGWKGSDVYFSRWQHWRIPVDAVQQAIAADDSPPETRRRYSGTDSAVLDGIRAWESRNRAEYRLA
jgi:hypothetical protein